MQCPHCLKTIREKENGVSLARENAEQYGSRNFTIRCPECKELFTFHIGRITTVQWVRKAYDHEEVNI
jgi:phage FluMu protein Com